MVEANPNLPEEVKSIPDTHIDGGPGSMHREPGEELEEFPRWGPGGVMPEPVPLPEPGIRRRLTGRIRRPPLQPRRVVPGRPHRPGVRPFPPFRPGLSFVLVA